MTERLPFLWAFGQIKLQHLKDSTEWFLYTIVGSLVPVWAGAVLYWIAPGGVSWLDFASHGEFALYSAALLAPAIYITVTEREDLPFPSRTLFVFVAFILLLVSLLIFAGITVLQRFNLVGHIKGESVVLWSLGLYVTSAIVAFVVDLFDNLRRAPDVRKLAADRQKALEQRFDELR